MGGTVSKKGEQPNKKYNVSDATSRVVDLDIPKSLLLPLYEETPTRHEFQTNQKNSRCFYVSNILTSTECDDFIEKAEKMKFDIYDDIKYEYPTTHRNNQRMIVINPDLAKSLWSRLQVHITANDVFNVSPIGFLSKGIWIPVGLNDGFIVSKYSPGQYFKPHHDGLYISKNEDHSIFSVVFYLNDLSAERGGSLNFLNEATNKKCSTYTPKKGSAIIFNSDALHESETLKEGYKYIIRTFIMFRCVKSFCEEERKTIVEDPNWNKIVDIFCNQIDVKAQSMGNLDNNEITEFTNSYLRAQKIQISQSQNIHELESKIPIDIYRLIFRRLVYNPSDVIKAMSINREWYRVARDNEIWRTIYLNNFPNGHHQNSFNYFGVYKNEKMKSSMKVMVLGDLCTIHGGMSDLPTQRAAGISAIYNKWDNSFVEPNPSERQNWMYEFRSKGLFELNYEVIQYFISRAAVYDIDSAYEGNLNNRDLLLVTFPEHMKLSSEKPTLPKRNSYYRIPFDMQKNLEYKGMGYRRFREVELCRIRVLFLEASVAACANFDLKNGIVVVLHRITVYYPGLLSVITVKDSTIISEKDKVLEFPKDTTQFLWIEDINKIIMKRSKEYSIYNIVFVCDSEKEEERDIFLRRCVSPIRKSLEKTETDNEKSMKKQKKVNFLSFWTANHFDLCYGAKKFQKFIQRDLFNEFFVWQFPRATSFAY